MEQASLGEGDPIPTLDSLQSSLDGVSVTESAYKQYYAPVLRTLESLDEGDLVSADDLYQTIDADVTDETKWQYVKRVFRHDPSFAEHLSDRVPPADTFLEVCARRAGLASAESICGENINDVQRECEKFGSEMRDRRAEELLSPERARREVLSEMHDSPHDEQAVRAALDDFYDALIDDPVAVADAVSAFDQGLLPVAGEANELLFVETLRDEGLVPGEDFHKVSDEGPHDLDVHSRVGRTLNVEVKSIAMRERGDAGVARISDPAVLAGFFDDPDELRARCEKLAEHCVAVYAPPETAAELHRPGGVPECGAGSFFRSNNRFAADMSHYVFTGELPPANPRHSLAFLSDRGDHTDSRTYDG